MDYSEILRMVLIFLAIGLVCLFYNKPIATELARIYIYPIKWIFGEKPWVRKAQNLLYFWMRYTLYFAVFISVLGIVFPFGTILKLW